MNRFWISFSLISCALGAFSAEAELPKKIDCRNLEGERAEVEFSLAYRRGEVYSMTGDLEDVKVDFPRVEVKRALRHDDLYLVVFPEGKLGHVMIALSFLPENTRADGAYWSDMEEATRLTCDLR